MEKHIVYTGADLIFCDRAGLDGDIRNILDGGRLGLLTAASGTDKRGMPTYLRLAAEGRLSVLFAPEHGIHSELQDGAWGGEYTDPDTGVPVYDLPAKGNPKIGEALERCDAVLYDIQDVGARFYTYIYCLAYLMHECAARHKPVIILDRPDPIGGTAVEGAMLDEARFSSFVGRYAMPARYAMTCGEFALWLNATHNVGCEVHVVRCRGWSRDMYADETDLAWINPSPNLPSVTASLIYIGTCLIEATNVSEGRGTTRPFELVGAPWCNATDLAARLNAVRLGGVYFSPAYFTPVFGKHAGTACRGVQINVTDRRAFRPHLAGLHLLAAMQEYPECETRENGLCLRYGTDALIGGFDPAAVAAAEHDGTKKFFAECGPYRLY